MPWKIIHVPDKPPSSPEMLTVDVVASIIEPKLANTLVRQLNQICPLENLRHVKRVWKRSTEGKVELSLILCLQLEQENPGFEMPSDVLLLASTYQLSLYKAKVAKYAALSKEEWEEQCKLWPTSYHPSTNPYDFTEFSEEEPRLILNYMKFAMRLVRAPNGKVVNAAIIVNPLDGKIISSGNDQTFFGLSKGETISNCVNDCEELANTFPFQPCGDSSGNTPQDFNRISCLYPWRWSEARPDNPKEKCGGNFSWHPLRHAALVAIENAAARDTQLFPLPNGGVSDCSYNNPTKRPKIQLSETTNMIAQDACPESSLVEALRPYLCTGFDIYIVWEPCVMCGMALVHQRIRRIFYAFPNPNAGALGSVYRLQGEKSLNHHYSVFRILIPEEELREIN